MDMTNNEPEPITETIQAEAQDPRAPETQQNHIPDQDVSDQNVISSAVLTRSRSPAERLYQNSVPKPHTAAPGRSKKSKQYLAFRELLIKGVVEGDTQIQVETGQAPSNSPGAGMDSAGSQNAQNGLDNIVAPQTAQAITGVETNPDEGDDSWMHDNASGDEDMAVESNKYAFMRDTLWTCLTFLVTKG